MKVNAQHNALSKVIKTRFKIDNIYSARCTLELLAELSVSRDCWRKLFDGIVQNMDWTGLDS